MEATQYNIPVYRAKKIDSDEYIKGYYVSNKENTNSWIRWDGYMREVDKSTLAIHFPDMLDSKGTEIFASLYDSGKGGDVLRFIDKFEWYRSEYCFALATNKEIEDKLKELPYYEFSAIFDTKEGLNFSFSDMIEERYKVIGIQK